MSRNNEIEATKTKKDTPNHMNRKTTTRTEKRHALIRRTILEGQLTNKKGRSSSTHILQRNRHAARKKRRKKSKAF